MANPLDGKDAKKAKSHKPTDALAKHLAFQMALPLLKQEMNGTQALGAATAMATSLGAVAFK